MSCQIYLPKHFIDFQFNVTVIREHGLKDSNLLNFLRLTCGSAYGVFFFVVVLFCFFKFYFIFKLYITVLDLPNIKMNPPQVYMCSPSWTLFPPPSPFHLPMVYFNECSMWTSKQCYVVVGCVFYVCQLGHFTYTSVVIFCIFSDFCDRYEEHFN